MLLLKMIRSLTELLNHPAVIVKVEEERVEEEEVEKSLSTRSISVKKPVVNQPKARKKPSTTRATKRRRRQLKQARPQAVKVKVRLVHQ